MGPQYFGYELSFSCRSYHYKGTTLLCLSSRYLAIGRGEQGTRRPISLFSYYFENVLSVPVRHLSVGSFICLIFPLASTLVDWISAVPSSQTYKCADI